MSDKFVTVKEFEEYKKSMEKKEEPKEKKEKVPRAPNSYNLFMKEKIAEMKQVDSKILNKDAFKKGAELWNKQKQEKQDQLNKEKPVE